MVIGAIVAVLLVGGFYMANRIANTDEAPETTSSQPTVTNTKPASDGYISPAGHLEAGITLYDKETKQPWGAMPAVPDSEQIEVLRINNMALGDDRTRGTARLIRSLLHHVQLRRLRVRNEVADLELSLGHAALAPIGILPVIAFQLEDRGSAER